MSRLSLRNRKVPGQVETKESSSGPCGLPTLTSRQAKMQGGPNVTRSPLSPLKNFSMTAGSGKKQRANTHIPNSDDFVMNPRVRIERLKSSPANVTTSSPRPSLNSKLNEILESRSSQRIRFIKSLQGHQETGKDSTFATKSFYRDKSVSLKSSPVIPKRSPLGTAKQVSFSPVSSNSKSPSSKPNGPRKNVRRCLSKTSSLNNLSGLDKAVKVTHPVISPRSPVSGPPTRKFFSLSSRKKFTTVILPFGEQKISTPSPIRKKRLLSRSNKFAKKRRVGKSPKSPVSPASSPSTKPISGKCSLNKDLVATDSATVSTDFEMSQDSLTEPLSPLPLVPSLGSRTESDFTESESRQEENSQNALLSESPVLSASDAKDDERVDFFDVEYDFLADIMTSKANRCVNPSSRSVNVLSKESPVIEKVKPISKTTQKAKCDQANLKSWIAEAKIDAKDGKVQLMIDAGQLNVGPTVCNECGMLYGQECSEDKAIHFKIHNKVMYSLRFVGWKKERVVKEYSDGRVLQILSEDPKYVQKKVEEVMEVVNMTLGFHEKARPDSMTMQVYMFVSDKKVVGALIANPIKQAFRCLPRPDESKPLTCSELAVFAVCGINRIWTLASHRRKKVATRLMQCMREHFYYGCVLSKNELAFSDPTPDGQMFAKHYMHSESFLVYK